MKIRKIVCFYLYSPYKYRLKIKAYIYKLNINIIVMVQKIVNVGNYGDTIIYNIAGLISWEV